MKLGKIYPDVFRAIKTALKEAARKRRKISEVDMAWRIRLRRPYTHP